jgi:hypothetical protein
MLAAACGDPGTDDSGDAGETGGASETGSEPPTTGGEESSTGTPFEPFPARGGIKVSRVEANPGVAVVLERDGVAVGGADRNAFIPQGRNTLVRVFLNVPEDWTARDLEVRLELSGGGVDKTLTDVFTIAEDTFDGQLGSGPYFGVDAADMVPGLKYRVSLWEAAPGAEGLPEPAEPPVSPVAGPGFVGVESAPAEMKVVLVPVDYDFGSCQAAVDGAAVEKRFADALYQQNGLRELKLEVHAPYKVDYDMREYQGLSRLVGEMSQLREAEGAAPNVYYYGLFDSCGACIGASGGISSGCTVGLAFDITGDEKSDAYARASAGQLTGDAEGTFVHEVGHTQGRRHIYCPSAGVEAAGTDPSYPYDGGVIGVWGFGVRDFKLRHPTANADYMSYCGQTWVSDWQWNATYRRIVELTSWDYEGGAAPTGTLLVGTIDPDGREAWWTTRGDFSADREVSATHALTFEFADGEVDAPVQVSVREDYPTRIVTARLPADFDARALAGLRLRDEQGERSIAAAAVRRLHRPEDLQAAH